jgi:hypothetical protein
MPRNEPWLVVEPGASSLLVEFLDPRARLSCEDGSKMNRREMGFDEAYWVKAD